MNRIASTAAQVPKKTPRAMMRRVHHPEMAPDAAIDAHHEERAKLRGQMIGSELVNIWKFFMNSSGSSKRSR